MVIVLSVQALFSQKRTFQLSRYKQCQRKIQMSPNGQFRHVTREGQGRWREKGGMGLHPAFAQGPFHRWSYSQIWCMADPNQAAIFC